MSDAFFMFLFFFVLFFFKVSSRAQNKTLASRKKKVIVNQVNVVLISLTGPFLTLSEKTGANGGGGLL